MPVSEVKNTFPKRPKPIRIEYSGEYSRGRDYIYNVQRKLEYGEIHEYLLETERWIVEGKDPEADKIIAYVRDKMDKLSVSMTGHKAPDLEIVLADTPDISTGVITRPDKPILIVGLGMMDRIIAQGFGEDHLVAVLGHERFHLRRHDKWKDLKNGRPEETIGDVYAVLESERAGYNPQAMGDFFRAIKKEYKSGSGWGAILGRLVGEHPSLDVRIRNTELALAELQLTKRMSEDQTEIPADIVEAVKNTRFKTHLDLYLERFSYKNASPSRKVELLGRYLASSLDTRDDCLADVYQEETEPLIEALRETEGVQKEAEYWFRFFLKQQHEWNPRSKNHWYRENEASYKWILHQFVQLMGPTFVPSQKKDAWETNYVNPDHVIPPIFKRFATDSKAFWAATTRQEAMTAIKRYQAAKKGLKRYESGIHALKLTEKWEYAPDRSSLKRDIKEHGKARLPWEQHVRWANGEGEETEADKADSKIIAQYARKWGAKDPRLPNYNPKNEVTPLGYKMDELVFDKDWNIIEVKPSQSELEEIERKKVQARFEADTAAELISREYDLQQERERSEHDLVKSTDWADMEKDFWRFVEQHKEDLIPTVTLVPGRFPFAEAFMERLEAFRAENPELWHGRYVEFLTGYSDNVRFKEQEKKRSWDDRKEYIPSNDLAFPNLLQEISGKYFGYFGKGTKYIGERGALPDNHPMKDLLASYHDIREPYLKRSRKNPQRKRYKVYPRKIAAEKHPVEIPFKIDIRHPFVKAITVLNEQDVTPRDKANLIEKFRYYNRYAKSTEQYFKISARRVFNYAAMQKPEDFSKGYRKSSDSDGRSHMIWREAYPIEFLRTLRRLDRKKPAERYSISSMDFFLLSHKFDHFYDKNVRKGLQKELKKLVERQVKRNRRIDFSVKTPVHTLIERYLEDRSALTTYEYHIKYLNGRKTNRSRWDKEARTHNIFVTRPKLEEAYLTRIKERIMALPVEGRHEHITQILGIQLQNPDYREWAIDTWVESTLALFGQDDGSEAYQEKMLSYMKSAVGHMSSAQSMNCMLRLVDGIEAQRGVSLGVKDLLVDTFGQRFLEKDGAMRIIDSAVDTCSHDPELRDAFLKYITEPLTDEGSQSFVKLLKKTSLKDRDREYEFVKKFFDPNRAINMSAKEENMTLDFLHQNFWAMPFGLRTIYLDRILFPVGETEDGDFEEAINFVLDKVLPLDKKLSAEAREALLVYLDTCPPELRRTTFSAILATTESASNKGEMRPGQVLSEVLSRTGAAGGQLLQAGHSYLSGLNLTDPDMIQFKEDLKKSKVDFAPPFRWEIFERLDEIMPDSLKNITYRVGRHLGSGSTAYVIEIIKEGLEKTALKLMRKDVMPIADLQFERFLSAFQTLAERHEHYKPLPSMVDHAKDMIQTAARGNVAAKQVLYAQTLYDPVSMKVNGKEFRFKVAPLVSYGEEYIETGLAEGLHLNDLENGEEKRDLSIGIETLEQYHTARGKAIDEDRHGGQQKIQGRLIHIFDVGAIPYSLEDEAIVHPKPFEKRALGHLFGMILNASAKGESPVKAMVDSVTTKNWGDAKPYLVAIQKGMLARMDVASSFGETEKEIAEVQKYIFRYVWKSGKVDPDLFKGFTETVDISACKDIAFDALKNVFKPAAHTIEIKDSAVSEKETVLGISEMLKMVAQTSLSRVFARSTLSSADHPVNAISEALETETQELQAGADMQNVISFDREKKKRDNSNGASSSSSGSLGGNNLFSADFI